VKGDKTIMAVEIMKPIKMTKEMETTLKDIEPNLVTLKFELEKAERAGIDVKELKVRFEEMKRMRLGLLREYT